MLDIHAHLHDSAFDADRDEVVARAFEAGVEKIITIGTSIEESERAVACAEKYGNVYASVGIHPDFFDEEYRIWNIEYGKEKQIKNEIDIQHSTFDILPKEKDEMRSLITNLKKIVESSSKVIAIGECGLDYFVHQSTDNSQQLATINSQQKTLAASRVRGQAIQKEGFLMQIELALELQLPLIIHCRPSVGTSDAYEDLFTIFSDSIFNIQHSIFILHCYMGDTEVTKKFLTLPSIYFSFTGNITYPVKKTIAGTKNDLTEVVKMIPIERILAETDCPYLAPQAYRGKRNEPVYVISVAEKIAELKGVSAEEVRKMTTLNAENIFALV